MTRTRTLPGRPCRLLSSTGPGRRDPLRASCPADLRLIEDADIRDLVRLQRDTRLKVITDGEARRAF